MLIITCIVGYLIVGAIIGLKDSEMIDGIFKEALKDVSGATKVVTLIISISGIILVAPIILAYFTIVSIYRTFRLKVAIYRLKRLLKKLRRG